MALGRRKNEEALEQIKALDWLRDTRPDLAHAAIHIPNERKANPWYGAFLKKMGVKRGVPDLFWPKPRLGYHGLFIEVKKIKGRPTKEQREFIKEVVCDGYYASFAYGHQEIISILSWYFEIPIK